MCLPGLAHDLGPSVSTSMLMTRFRMIVIDDYVVFVFL